MLHRVNGSSASATPEIRTIDGVRASSIVPDPYDASICDPSSGWRRLGDGPEDRRLEESCDARARRDIGVADFGWL